ncbi:MAG: ImmA/IrrE family metallo-endopeptidase [Vitreimonas sp.]
MTTTPRALSPQRWANEISLVLNAALGADRFPVNVPEVAREISRTRFPDDPVSVVRGDILPGFDGALYRAPAGKKGWGIFYNSGIRSEGRINFTLGHEFGHYLLHRLAHPNGFQCGEQDVVRWDSEYGQIEHQANVFAANLLMPFDDYRRQIEARADVDLDMISACANRYRVSLVAAILRWIDYTERRAVLVVSCDGFILWARSSKPALRTGAFFRTSKVTIPVPATSLAALGPASANGPHGVQHPAGVWFAEPVREMAVHSEQYHFRLSLLVLPSEVRYVPVEPDEEDTYDRFMRR